MAQLGLRDEGLRGSHRSGAVNEHDECRKQCGCVEQRSNDRSEEGQECAVALHFDHVLHGKSSGSHRKSTARMWHGGVATSLSSAFFKEQCMTCCDDARSDGVSVRHERCGELSRDDGTGNHRVQEIREHRNSRTLKDWHRDSSSGGRTNVDASHHELRTSWQHSRTSIRM